MTDGSEKGEVGVLFSMTGYGEANFQSELLSLAIEMRDHIVVVDTPQTEERALAVLAKAKELIPNMAAISTPPGWSDATSRFASTAPQSSPSTTPESGGLTRK